MARRTRAQREADEANAAAEASQVEEKRPRRPHSPRPKRSRTPSRIRNDHRSRGGENAEETTVEVVSPLIAIAQNIHDTWATTKQSQVSAWDGYINVGALLRDARNEFTANRAFGTWFDEQNFGFSQQWANRLRTLADNEATVRAFLTEAVAAGEAVPGVNSVIARITAPPPPLEGTATAETTEDGDATPEATQPEAYVTALELLTDLARVNYARNILPHATPADITALQTAATRADRVIHRILVVQVAAEATAE